MRNFHFPGRSPVFATRAMCATSHSLASVTAIEMLKRGGNAADAAIAAAAVLAVVEPHMTGIGGDCFAILARPGAPPVALSGAGRAPLAAEAGWYAERGLTSIPLQSPHAVTVPCAIDTWARLLADHGSISLGDALAPAIGYAERGVPVSPRVAHDWARHVAKLSGNEGARKHLLKDGRAPRLGEIVRFPALARTLRRIAEQGRDAFYEGEIAEDMVAELRALGGLHTLDDFATQRASYVAPISVTHGDMDILELPPSNQGITGLIMLKMLSRMRLPSRDPAAPERYHVLMEAARLAYAMRDRFVADPEMAAVPVEHMLSDRVIDDLAGRIDPNVRRPELGAVPEPAGSDTIYLAVVDESGLAVSFINSVFTEFGTGIMTRKTGVLFHNRAQGFVLDPRHPNCIAPRKRPLHTLIPAMGLRDGAPCMAFGVMGAAFQPMGQVYVITNMLDYGMDPQEAIDFPRMFPEGGLVLAEQSVPQATFDRLAAMGHPMRRRELPWGGGQAVLIDRAASVLIGASDPRKDGCALGY